MGGNGDANAAHQRLNALNGIRELEVVDQVIDMAQELIIQAALPSKAKLDALHIANPIQRPVIESVIRSFGYTPPVICTPQELLEALNADHKPDD